MDLLCLRTDWDLVFDDLEVFFKSFVAAALVVLESLVCDALAFLSLEGLDAEDFEAVFGLGGDLKDMMRCFFKARLVVVI